MYKHAVCGIQSDEWTIVHYGEFLCEIRPLGVLCPSGMLSRIPSLDPALLAMSPVWSDMWPDSAESVNQSDPAYASELNELSGQTVWRVPHSSIFSEYSLNIPNDSQVLAVLLITFADYWSHGGRIEERDVTHRQINTLSIRTAYICFPLSSVSLHTSQASIARRHIRHIERSNEWSGLQACTEPTQKALPSTRALELCEKRSTVWKESARFSVRIQFFRTSCGNLRSIGRRVHGHTMAYTMGPANSNCTRLSESARRLHYTAYSTHSHIQHTLLRRDSHSADSRLNGEAVNLHSHIHIAPYGTDSANRAI